MNNSETPQRDLPRCEAHNLVVGPDGRCVLCRRDQHQPHRSRLFPRLVFFGLLFVLLIIGIGALRNRQILTEKASSEVAQPIPATNAPTTLAAQVEPKLKATGRYEATRRIAATPKPPQAQVATSSQLNDGENTAETRHSADREAAATRERAKSGREALVARRRMDQMYHNLVNRQAHNQVSIKLYFASWCGACKRALRWTNKHGLRVQAYDIDRDPAADKRLRAINPRRSIPTWDIGGQVLIGFSPRRIKQAIQYAAQRPL